MSDAYAVGLWALLIGLLSAVSLPVGAVLGLVLSDSSCSRQSVFYFAGAVLKLRERWIGERTDVFHHVYGYLVAERSALLDAIMRFPVDYGKSLWLGELNQPIESCGTACSWYQRQRLLSFVFSSGYRDLLASSGMNACPRSATSHRRPSGA